jgi:type II pantothenate kinase
MEFTIPANTGGQEEGGGLDRMRVSIVPHAVPSGAAAMAAGFRTATAPPGGSSSSSSAASSASSGGAAAAAAAASAGSGRRSSAPAPSPVTVSRMRTHSGDDGDVGAAMGLDIGGTLSKFAIFEPYAATSNESLNLITAYIKGHDTFGKTGQRNKDLIIESPACGGRVHFVTFETSRMEGALDLIKKGQMHVGIHSMYATGGGAHKYADMFRDHLGVDLLQTDELATVVRGLQFVVSQLDDAVYTLTNVDFSATPVALDAQRSTAAAAAAAAAEEAEAEAKAAAASASASAPRRTRRQSMAPTRVNVSLRGGLFPFVLCNIGSGVSIVQVKSETDIARISGTALGGSTFFGLCRLLTKAQNFADALDLADHGDSTNVNLLVRDIYGGNYKQFGLAGDLTASFFGKMCREDDPRDKISDADVARALVIMITQNISQIAFLNARAIPDCQRVIFTGNFLRHNTIACRTLAYGMQRWSQLGGKPIQPLFLKHEGALGALGAFLENYKITFDEQGSPFSPASKRSKSPSSDIDAVAASGDL